MTREALIHALKELGYETGRGQFAVCEDDVNSLADEILELARKFELDKVREAIKAEREHPTYPRIINTPEHKHIKAFTFDYPYNRAYPVGRSPMLVDNFGWDRLWDGGPICTYGDFRPRPTTYPKRSRAMWRKIKAR